MLSVTVKKKKNNFNINPFGISKRKGIDKKIVDKNRKDFYDKYDSYEAFVADNEVRKGSGMIATKGRLSANCNICREDNGNERPCMPEENMIVAVIERAVRDLFLEGEQKLLRQARAWIRSDDTEEWSFLWCASEINLSSTFVERIIALVPLDESENIH